MVITLCVKLQNYFKYLVVKAFQDRGRSLKLSSERFSDIFRLLLDLENHFIKKEKMHFWQFFNNLIFSDKEKDKRSYHVNQNVNEIDCKSKVLIMFCHENCISRRIYDRFFQTEIYVFLINLFRFLTVYLILLFITAVFQQQYTLTFSPILLFGLVTELQYYCI